MGLANENANAMIKVFNEHQEAMGRALKQDSLRVSQIKDVQYSLSNLTTKRCKSKDANTDDRAIYAGQGGAP